MRRRQTATLTVLAAFAILACQANEVTAPHNPGLVAEPNAAQGPNNGQEAQCETVLVTAPTPTIAAGGGMVQATAVPLSKNGKALDKATVAWSSLDMSVAVVTSTGLITGVNAGSATIRAVCSATPGFGDLLINVQ